jgi:alpha-L-fucosidase
VVGELVRACRKGGIRFGAYYSTCDWRHPAFPFGSPGGGSHKPHPDMAAYDRYLRAQTAELVKKYGPLLTLWFDIPQSYTEKYGLPTVRYLRKLQPDILINNRIYTPSKNNKDFAHQNELGDFNTPEQKIGNFNRERPWETCMTICQQWSWKPNDKLKSLEQCVRTLLYTIGGDGNLLLNVGPMPDGRIEPRQVERLKEMGQWVKKYSEAIYDTRGGPFKPGKWGASVCKGRDIYLFVMDWQNGDTITLPPIDAKILETKVLSGGTATVTQDKNGIKITLPQKDHAKIATVIKMRVDRDAFSIKPVDVK